MASELPWIKRIEELIEHGPVEVNWLMAEVAGLVPPGRAWRMREWLREYAARRKGLQYRPSTEITDEAIRSGQRSVVRESIGKLVYAKSARYLVEDGVKYLEKAYKPTPNHSARGRKAWARASDEEREEWKEKLYQAKMSKTPQERSEMTRRGWETRRRNKQPLN